MKRLSKQQYVNKNLNAKKFVTQEQLNTLQYITFSEIFNTFTNNYWRIWETKINNVCLNFKSKNDYLETNNLKKMI